MDPNDCCKSFYDFFVRYLELPTSERSVLRVVGTVRGNLMNLISTNVLGFRLFLSQFLKLVDRTDYRKSFLGVFPLYIELQMSERRVLGVVRNVRGNPTNLCSTTVLR